MRKSNKKSYVLVALVVLLLAIAVGYAAFTSQLTISGTATGNGTWDVRFLQDGTFLQADGTTTDTTHSGTATVSTSSGGTTNDTMTVSVSLGYPGDGVILEVKVKNNGTVPARLTNFTVSGASNGLIVTPPTVTAGASNGDTLEAGATCTMRFVIKWDETSDTFGDNTNHQQTFTITYNYAQATDAFNALPSHLTHTSS